MKGSTEILAEQREAAKSVYTLLQGAINDGDSEQIKQLTGAYGTLNANLRAERKFELDLLLRSSDYVPLKYTARLYNGLFVAARGEIMSIARKHATELVGKSVHEIENALEEICVESINRIRESMRQMREALLQDAKDESNPEIEKLPIVTNAVKAAAQYDKEKRDDQILGDPPEGLTVSL
jgi:hypothetical protein